MAELAPADVQPRAATSQASQSERRHTALLIAGAATFVSSYLITALMAAMMPAGGALSATLTF